MTKKRCKHLARAVRVLSPPDHWTRYGEAPRSSARRSVSWARREDRPSRAKRQESRARSVTRRMLPACRDGHRGGLRQAVAAGALTMLLPLLSAAAQTPNVPAPYRAPTIAMVQPVNGGTVPRDKPIVVFRFARGEAADPVDVGTFAVTVNGVDRTPLFQVTAEEAWGALTRLMSSDSVIALGPHSLAARICSVRGACAETASRVVAVDAPTVTAASASTPVEPAKSTRARVIELVLDAVRKLIVP